MIGQNKIKQWVEQNAENFPHFIVLIGPRYFGKRTLAKSIARRLALVYADCGIGVDSVREVIKNSYTLADGKGAIKVMHCFEDADDMRPQAKNALLKITEEPPENGYFCMTVRDSGSLLETLKSRAQVFTLEPYTKNDIEKYLLTDTTIPTKDCSEVKSVCMSIGEAELLIKYGVSDFISYVKLVIDNIAEVEPANAFKSSQYLALSNEEGYDLCLFFRAFILESEKRLTENTVKYAKYIEMTSKYLQKAERIGVNRKQTYDMWVLDIRNVE